MGIPFVGGNAWEIVISKREDRKTNWNFPADDINAEGTPVLLFSFSSSPFFPFFFSFLFFFFFACWNNTFRDRFGSSVKSRTFRDVVTKLRALQLQTPNSPYDPALFRKPQSLYSWDDRATRFCGTSAPTEDSTPKLHFLRCGEGFPWFEDNAKLLISRVLSSVFEFPRESPTLTTRVSLKYRWLNGKYANNISRSKSRSYHPTRWHFYSIISKRDFDQLR